MYFKNRIILIVAAICLSAYGAGARNGGGADFAVRGFHVDLKVQTMAMDALKGFAKELSDLGMNTMLLEWEATFPFYRHATISNEHSYTPEEIVGFIEYCQGIGIDVIPLQQCFGHVEYILRHDRYSSLRENFHSEFSQVCPLNPDSEKIFHEIITEVAAMHPSEYFHIGCDETFLLGLCPECRAYVEQYGKSKLFVDYVSKMCNIVSELGKRPIIWADIIIKYPEAVDRLPENTILMDWNYGWDINLFGDIQRIYDSGLEIWGAPAIRSDPDTQYLITWNTHFDNQRDFIPYSRKAGYKGMVMTSWSASGLYGLYFDVKNEVVGIDAVRNVYPTSGFGILVASYAEAIERKEPIDPKEFITRYAVEQFGLPDAQAAEFCRILYTSQGRIKNGKPMGHRSIRDMLNETDVQRERLYAFSPSRNTEEFEHFRLLWDIRAQYLEFKVINEIYNSPDFDRSMAADLLERLEKNVLSQTYSLDRRFIELNGNYLKPEELLFQNNLRVRKINNTANAMRALVR